MDVSYLAWAQGNMNLSRSCEQVTARLEAPKTSGVERPSGLFLRYEKVAYSHCSLVVILLVVAVVAVGLFLDTGIKKGVERSA